MICGCDTWVPVQLPCTKHIVVLACGNSFLADSGFSFQESAAILPCLLRRITATHFLDSLALRYAHEKVPPGSAWVGLLQEKAHSSLKGKHLSGGDMALRYWGLVPIEDCQEADADKGLQVWVPSKVRCYVNWSVVVPRHGKQNKAVQWKQDPSLQGKVVHYQTTSHCSGQSTVSMYSLSLSVLAKFITRQNGRIIPSVPGD